MICLCVFQYYNIFSFVLNSCAIQFLLYLRRGSKLLELVSGPFVESIKMFKTEERAFFKHCLYVEASKMNELNNLHTHVTCVT